VKFSFNIDVSKCLLYTCIYFLGFNYEFNALTSSNNELAAAYDSVTNVRNQFLRIIMSVLSNYISFIRYIIPIEMNRKFINACAVIDRISKKLIREKYKEAENGELKGNDLLSLLININKTLPAEEKMTDEELKYQVIKLIG
jgi:hypothetical protein